MNNLNEIRKQEHNGELYYSIIDIIGILTNSNNPQNYWNKLKKSILKDKELSTKCIKLKLKTSNGKISLTDCATRETIFKIIQALILKLLNLAY